jgi:hypothetical protein
MSHAPWRADGKELFFLDSDSAVVAADVKGDGAAFEYSTRIRSSSPSLQVQDSRGLAFYFYDVAPDGQRFLMVTPSTMPDWTSRLPWC